MQIRGNFQVFVQILAPMIVGIIASYSVTDSDQWNRLQRGFLHSLVFIFCVFVYFWYGPPAQYQGAFGFGGMDAAGGPRALGYGARPAGMTLAIIGCVLLANIQKSRKRSLFCWLVCVTIAVLSGSRMATIVLLLTSMLSPLYRSLRSRIVAVSLIGLLAFVLFYTPMMQSRFFYSGEGKLSDIPTADFADQGRLDFWAATLEEAQRHILLGAGVGESDIFISSIFEIYQVHNDYLRILFELGVVGLGLFLCTVGLQVIGLRRLMRSESGEGNTAAVAAFLGVLTWLCFSVTDNPIIYNVFFTHPLFAIVGAAYGLAGSRRQLSSEPTPSTSSLRRAGVTDRSVESRLGPHRAG
jgi:O-antigen ligase